MTWANMYKQEWQCAKDCRQKNAITKLIEEIMLDAVDNTVTSEAQYYYFLDESVLVVKHNGEIYTL